MLHVYLLGLALAWQPLFCRLGWAVAVAKAGRASTGPVPALLLYHTHPAFLGSTTIPKDRMRQGLVNLGVQDVSTGCAGIKRQWLAGRRYPSSRFRRFMSLHLVSLRFQSSQQWASTAVYMLTAFEPIKIWRLVQVEGCPEESVMFINLDTLQCNVCSTPSHLSFQASYGAKR